MNKKIPFPIAVIIIAVLAALVIGTVIYCQKRGWGSPSILFPPKEITFSNDCNELIRQINDLVAKANYCNVDSDCAISTEVTKFCGCWSLINKNADLTKIKEGNEKYQLNCPPVLCAECMLTPQQGDIKCENHKCVDTRFIER